MANLDTVNVGGIDYQIQDATARSTANTANNNATSALASLSNKMNLSNGCVGVLSDALLVDTGNYKDEINQPHGYTSSSTINLPAGAILGIRNVYYYDSNNICVELIDIRAKKVWRNHYWGPSQNWQGWQEAGGIIPPSVLSSIKQFAYKDGVVTLNNVTPGAYIIAASDTFKGTININELGRVAPAENQYWQILFGIATSSTVYVEGNYYSMIIELQ